MDQQTTLQRVSEVILEAIQSVGFDSLKRLQAAIEEGLKSLRHSSVIENYRVDFIDHDGEKIGVVTYVNDGEEQQVGFPLPN